MTAAQLSTEFDILLDAVASGVAPGFLNSEKSRLLTKAQNELIDTFVRLKDYKTIYTIVEQARISSLTQDSNYTGKTYYINLEDEIPNFRYYISSRLQVSRTNPTLDSERVNCELIERKDMYKFLEDGFNIPYFKRPKSMLEYNEGASKNRLYVVLDYYTSTPSNLEVSYVRMPADIDIDTPGNPELPEFLHKEIVSLAVNMAVESLFKSKIPQKE